MEAENKTKPKHTIITVDGPAGAGKSTVAKKMAKALRYFYLDTGAMYRALTLKALMHNIDLSDGDRLAELAKDTTIDLQETIDGLKVFLDDVDVSEKIRSVDVTNNTSLVASNPKVRDVLVDWQRRIASSRDVVIEGRDTGTVVFPGAQFKFYVDATLAERARRRLEELKKKGMFVEEEKLIHQINERDHKDMNRAVGPLKKAEDAIIIDSTGMSVDEMVSQMLQFVSRHG